MTLNQEGRSQTYHSMRQIIKTDESHPIPCSAYTVMIFVWSVWRGYAHKLSEANCHLFIMPDLWPPNSRDLSPIDYKMWDIFSKESARQKCRIWMIWEAASDWCVGWNGTERYWQYVIIDHWRRPLYARIRVSVSVWHFEFWLWHRLVKKLLAVIN